MAIIKLIIKYGFVFFLAGFALIGVLTHVSLWVENREQLSSILSDLGNFGAFLSGLGTLVAAAAAAVGVDNWIKQMKYGKYLTIIWDAHVAVREVRSLKISWSIFASMRNEEHSDESHVNLVEAFAKLESCCEQLDGIVVRNQSEWSNYCSQWRLNWLRIESYYNENPCPSRDNPQAVADEHLALLKLNKIFDKGYETIVKKLDDLEQIYSK